MKIAVLNPNSSTAVTASMEGCLAPLRAATEHDIRCYTLAEGPIGIETDDDVDFVAPKVADFIRRTEADAYVVACFSDPGLAGARAATTKPVFGIAESAYYAAITQGGKFGVISLGPSSIARHLKKIESLSLTPRLAGDRSIDMTVAEANDAESARPTIERIARGLLDEDGADVLILGCAGMGEQRPTLQPLFGSIVIDPVQAGVWDAITALTLDYRKDA